MDKGATYTTSDYSNIGKIMELKFINSYVTGQYISVQLNNTAESIAQNSNNAVLEFTEIFINVF